ncbi:unnamed protein product, partial [Rotaria sp. Silwood2]
SDGLKMMSTGKQILQIFRVWDWQWIMKDPFAGKNGERPEINQLLEPVHIFVDQDKSVIVADFQSARVMKWPVGVKEGIVVAGGNGEGDGANQLNGMKYSTIMLIVILL